MTAMTYRMRAPDPLLCHTDSSDDRADTAGVAPYRHAAACSLAARLTVEDIMHAGLIGCAPDAPLATVAWILADERIHAVVVQGVEAGGDSHADTWGVITALDVMHGLGAGGEELTAWELVKRSPRTVAPTDRVDRVVRLMTEHDLTHVLVVEDGSPVGMISALDVARVLGSVRASTTAIDALSGADREAPRSGFQRHGREPTRRS